MSEDFNTRYRLLKCIAVDEGIRTHNAQELKTGRVVMVHLADAAGPEDVDRLKKQLGQLSASDKNRVLETSTLPSGFAVVTEFIAGLNSFPGWLRQRGEVSSPAAMSAPTLAMEQPTTPVLEARTEAGTEPLPKSPGEFTLMFGKSSVAPSFEPIPESNPDPMLGSNSEPISIQYQPISEAATTRQEPGEFTKLFAAPATAVPLPAEPAKSPVAPSLPPVPQSAAGFSTVPPPLFSEPSQAPPLFSQQASASQPPPPPPLPPMAPPSVPPAPAPVAPVGSPRAESPAILPPPIFATSAGSSTPLSPLGGGQPSSPSRGLSGGEGVGMGLSAAAPSDFTRMISKAAAPALPVQKPSTDPALTATATKQKRAIPMPLLIIINAVVLVAIALVLYALTRRTPSIPAAGPGVSPGVSAPSVPSTPATPSSAAPNPAAPNSGTSAPGTPGSAT